MIVASDKPAFATAEGLKAYRNLISVLAALAAVAIFLGYTFSLPAQALYTNLTVLRLATIPVVIWMLRMIWLSELGKEDYDPIVFVSHDRFGLAIIAACFAMVLIAV